MTTRTPRTNGSADDSAIKQRAHPLTQEPYTIVSQQMPDGQFIASIAEDQSFCATATTRYQAEESAAENYASRSIGNPAVVSQADTADAGETKEEDGEWFRQHFADARHEYAQGNFTRIRVR